MSSTTTTDPEPFAYDLFISYSDQDAPWVRGELLRRLEGAGLQVCIDFRDFRPGAPKVTERERAVLTSHRTLLILTPAYLASEWTEFEALLLQTLGPSNRELRLIPLLKEVCDLPPRLSIFTYVNFADPTLAGYVWRQLLTALGAPPPPEAEATPLPTNWALIHPYPMPPHFTGRVAERQELSHWLTQDADHPLLLVRALGGFGKSALCWHWLLHDVDARRWPQVLWWSFYEGDASFERFLDEAMDYLRIEPRPTGLRHQADALLTALRRPGLLLILDGFERQLRAFAGLTAAYRGDEAFTPPQPSPNRGGSSSLANGTAVPPPSWGRLGGGDTDRQCVSPVAEQFLLHVATLPGMQGKVLLTTRLRPSGLESHGGALLTGCREIELRQMHPTDAVALFQALGIRGHRNEIENACAPYGYHPLALRLLAGLVINDWQTPGDIAAAQRLKLHGDLKQRQHHVLAQAYQRLTPARRQLLSTIACFRFGVEYPALQAIAEQIKADNVDADLRDLLRRGLLQRDPHNGRFDLHPIVRHYAYERLTKRSRQSVHRRLLVYFQAVPAVELPQRLDDMQPQIELYHHTLAAGRYNEACDLFYSRIEEAIYYQFGAYQLGIELLVGLFPDSNDPLPQLKYADDQAWVLNVMANFYSASGQPNRSVSLFEQHNLIQEKRDDKQNLAIGHGNLASMAQLPIGAWKAAAANLYSSIALCQEIEDKFGEAVWHQELGLLLAYTGSWQEAEEELVTAHDMLKKLGGASGSNYFGIVSATCALCSLLLTRDCSLSLSKETVREEALAAAFCALDLADEFSKDKFRIESDYVRSHWLLGAAHRLRGNHATAEQHLFEALTRCRNINIVSYEANILIDLSRLSIGQGDPDAAHQFATQALTIAERCGYVLQAADAHLELAKLALARGNRPTARHHAGHARRYAICDGPPDWTYKVAYDEAGALLAELEG